jgi:hypothetical protein
LKLRPPSISVSTVSRPITTLPRPSQQGEEAPAPTPPSFSLSRACTRSPEELRRSRATHRASRCPRPAAAAAVPRIEFAMPSRTRSCPRCALSCPVAPPQRARRSRQRRRRTSSLRRRGRTHRPDTRHPPFHRGPVDHAPAPRSTARAVDPPLPSRRVASLAGRPRRSLPFCRKPPTDFGNKPAVHNSSKLIRFRSCF